ncbi:putative Jerky protein-like 70, partial [Homarus americanus]
KHQHKKKGWLKLWPALMFENFPEESEDNDFAGFCVSKEKEIVHKLLEYARGVTGSVANEVGSRLSEENLTERRCLVVHHYSDSEIVDIVLNPEKNNEGDEEHSDEEETDEAERVSIDKLSCRISLSKG